MARLQKFSTPETLAATFGSQVLIYRSGDRIVAVADHCCPPATDGSRDVLAKAGPAMSGVLDLLLAPVAYSFMQRGVLAAVVVGVLCAVVGCYVVLRGMAFLGDALAHAILSGVAVAYLLRGDLLVGRSAPRSWWPSSSACSLATARSRRIRRSASCSPPPSRWAWR